VPVLAGSDLVGIVTRRDMRFETQLDKPVAAIMTPRDKLVTVREGAEADEVQRLLHSTGSRRFSWSTTISTCAA
jgi:IMP dehydrogenase